MDISRVQVIEKDFWVCWTLRRLFTLCSASQLQPVTFKGGTTLSKVYRLIERFSEDIDISFGHEIFLDSGIGDPYAAETENQKKKRAKMLREKCGTYVSGPVLEALGGEISSLLGPEGWRLQPDRDRMSLRFSYPADFPSEADTPMSDSVKMEFGISNVSRTERQRFGRMPRSISRTYLPTLTPLLSPWRLVERSGRRR